MGLKPHLGVHVTEKHSDGIWVFKGRPSEFRVRACTDIPAASFESGVPTLPPRIVAFVEIPIHEVQDSSVSTAHEASLQLPIQITSNRLDVLLMVSSHILLCQLCIQSEM